MELVELVFGCIAIIGILIVSVVFIYYAGLIFLALFGALALIAGALCICQQLYQGDYTGFGILTALAMLCVGSVYIFANRKRKN